MVDDWDPDELYDERRPPNEDALELDELEPDDQGEDVMFGEPEDESEDWLDGPETAAARPASVADQGADEADDWSPMRRAVVVGATAAVGVAAILVAVLRRRG